MFIPVNALFPADFTARQFQPDAWYDACKDLATDIMRAIIASNGKTQYCIYARASRKLDDAGRITQDSEAEFAQHRQDRELAESFADAISAELRARGFGVDVLWENWCCTLVID